MKKYLLCITKEINDVSKYLTFVKNMGYVVYDDDVNDSINNIIKNGFPTDDLYSIILFVDDKKYWDYHNKDYNAYLDTIVDNSEESLIIINNMIELYKYMGRFIDYNEPKKLVYESKILKYNDFKCIKI